jgi:transcriptional regulator with XRE-family HTH domain
MKIGERLRECRKRRGLSLRALAQASGVTVGALSQIENDHSSPSVSTLKRVLNPLGLSMADFFGEVEPRSRACSFLFRRDDLVDLSPTDGLQLLSLPLEPGADRKMQVLEETYSPGVNTGEKAYSHKGEECGICLEGSVELTVNSETAVLRPGDVYYFNSESPHRFHNPNSHPARLISVCLAHTF